MVRLLLLQVIILLASCKTHHSVATTAFDFSSWQSTFEARLDSVVSNVSWTVDSLVIEPIQNDTTAPVQRLTAKKATVAMSQKRISSEVVETQRTDSAAGQSSHEEEPAPESPSSSWWVTVAIAIIIIELLKK